jgi:hypothetical protein
MQYMARLSLARRLRDSSERIPLDLCVQTLVGITQGLEAAFQHGILHRNINPNNILFDSDDNAKIADFGLACSIWDDQCELRRNLRDCFASFAYISPEKGLTGREDVRGDIYSVGVTAYHMLTGRTPFLDEITDEAFGTRLTETARPPQELREDIPDALNELVTRMVDPVPERRPRAYGDVLTVLDGCRRAAKGKRIVSFGKNRPVAANVAAPPARPASGAGAGRKRPAAKPGQGHWGWRGFSLALLFLAMVGGLTLVLGSHRRAGWYVRYVEPALQSWRGQGKRPPAVSRSDDDIRPTQERFVVVDEKPLDLGDVGTEATSAEAGNETEPAKNAVANVEPAADGSAVSGAGGAGAGISAPAWRVKRPRPEDLDFFRVANSLRVYLRTVPPAEQAAEKERIRELSLMRGYLVSLFKFIPFDGKEQGVRLRDGSTVYGSVYGSEKELIVRPERGNFRKLSWGDLAVAQYPVFFEYYILQRMERSDPSVSRKIGATAQKREIGGDYFRLALLCDWYSLEAAAQKYAKLAIERDRGVMDQVVKLLPQYAVEPLP